MKYSNTSTWHTSLSPSSFPPQYNFPTLYCNLSGATDYRKCCKFSTCPYVIHLYQVSRTKRFTALIILDCLFFHSFSCCCCCFLLIRSQSSFSSQHVILTVTFTVNTVEVIRREKERQLYLSWYGEKKKREDENEMSITLLRKFAWQTSVLTWRLFGRYIRFMLYIIILLL